MAKAKAVSKKGDFWRGRQGHFIAVVLCLIAAYIIASRAIDTGSLIEYFLAFSLIGFAINHTVKAIRS